MIRFCRREERFHGRGSQKATHSLLRIANETDGDEGGAPPLELCHPITKGGFGGNHHMGSRDVSHEHHVAQKSNGLQSLPKAL